VPSGEHGDQQFLDHGLLTDDYSAELIGDVPIRLV
jgi:hypothetical protein